MSSIPPTSAGPGPGAGYPLQFTVDYPERDRDRLTAFFRIFVAIPIVIVLATLGERLRPGVGRFCCRRAGRAQSAVHDRLP